MSTKDLHEVLWKSSVLPLLFAQLDTNPDHDLGGIDRVDDMIDMSRKIRVVMEGQNPPVFSER